MHRSLRHLASCLITVFALSGAVCAQGNGVPSANQANPSTSIQTAAGKDLEQTLRAVCSRVEAFSKVKVAVQNRVVTLSGEADSSALRDHIANIAKGLPGVLYVDNQVTLPEPDMPADVEDNESPSAADQRLAERLRNIFMRFDALRALEVDVAAGVVELHGQVIDVADRDTAEELARSVDGVVFVSNQIEETTDITERILPSLNKMVGWVRSAIAMLPLLLVALGIAAFFGWLGRRVARADRLLAKLTPKKLVQDILRQVIKTVLLLLGIFLALEVLGATALVGAVLGAAGVVGLALGFAFRDIVENYLASIILSVRQPFRSKDFVEIDGNRGTVIHLTTRDTVLLTADGNHLTLPNAMVFKSSIVNFTRAPRRRFDLAVGVGTDVDLTEATKLGLSVLRDMKGIVDDPAPYARVENLGDSTVSMRFYGWVDQREADYSKVKSEAVRLIKGIMDENQIDMPVPMYQLDIRKPSLGPDSKKAVEPAVSARKQAEAADVSLEREIEKQVDEELARSDDVDLLPKNEGAAGRLAQT